MADCYGLDKDDLPSDAFPITYQLINCKQQKDKTLLGTIKQGAKHYTLKEFHGGGRSSQLFCYKDRIVIPQCRTAKMSHAVVSPHSMPPRNQSNWRNHLSTFLLEEHKRSYHTQCVYVRCMSKTKETEKSTDYSRTRKSMHIRCSGIYLGVLNSKKFNQEFQTPR